MLPSRMMGFMRLRHGLPVRIGAPYFKGQLQHPIAINYRPHAFHSDIKNHMVVYLRVNFSP